MRLSAGPGEALIEGLGEGIAGCPTEFAGDVAACGDFPGIVLITKGILGQGEE